MILVDSSIWIEHLRRGSPQLRQLLEDGQVLVHPMIIGELACGSIADRAQLLELLRMLPLAPEASHEEALGFIEDHRLMARGIGHIDVHLLASTMLAEDGRLWTADARLAAAASRLFVAFESADGHADAGTG